MSLLKSKIHKAKVTRADLHYEGSLEIDLDIMDKVGLVAYEKILVVNINNGERLETYVIPGPRGSKDFLLNGAAARKGSEGDRIIIMSFADLEVEEAQNHLPKTIVLDEENNIVVEKGALALA